MKTNRSRDLLLQPPKQSIDGDIAVRLVDRFGERYGHWADLDAVLGVAAVADAVVAEETV